MSNIKKLAELLSLNPSDKDVANSLYCEFKRSNMITNNLILVYPEDFYPEIYTSIYENRVRVSAGMRYYNGSYYISRIEHLPGEEEYSVAIPILLGSDKFKDLDPDRCILNSNHPHFRGILKRCYNETFVQTFYPDSVEMVENQVILKILEV